MIQYIYFIVLVYAYLEAQADANLLNRGYYIHEHTTRFLRRFLVVSSFSLILYLFIDWKIVLNYYIAHVLLFASTFDNILNKLRNKTLFSLGKTAKWDKFWRKHKVLYTLFILLGFSLSIYLNFFKL